MPAILSSLVRPALASVGGEMRNAHGRRAAAGRGGDPLDRPVPDVAGREHARD